MNETKILGTNSGMWALWDCESYKDVTDYEHWEPLFCEDKDIEKQIETNAFVPIYVHADGIRSFTLRINEELSEKEENYIITKSEEYLFSTSGRIAVSGIDYISSDVVEQQTILAEVPKGYYSVEIVVIAWDDDPEAFLENGEVSEDALSDFVVILRSDADPHGAYRKSVDTFKKGEWICLF